MLNRIRTESDEEKYALIYGSYKLFNEVDINGDGNMEWSEFMQYIIDAVSANTITAGEGQETVAEQIAALKAKQFSRFGMAKRAIDKTNHANIIENAIFC